MAELTASETLNTRFLNPAVPARLGLLVIVVFVMVMLGWGALAPLSGAVVANGVLQADGGRKTVQHPYGGVVGQVLVHEGDTVRHGEVLMRLSDAEPRAQYDVLSSERNTLLATQGRLLAERDGRDAPAFPQELLSHAGDASAKQAMASEIALMAARAKQFETGGEVLVQQKAQLSDRGISAQAQIDGLQQQRASLASELKDARALLDQQLVERNRVLELERAITDLEAQIAVQRADLGSANKAIAEADAQLAGLTRDRLADISKDLQTNQAALAAIAPKLSAAQDALRRTDIVATANGTVVGLKIVTEGGVIAAGQELLSIVPTDNPLMVEAQMRLADVTDVARGETADIRLLAVPAISRPVLTGRVETVSADRVVDERSGQSYYALRIALNPALVAQASVELQSGMPVQVVIPTKGRTMMDYLVSPLFDELSGAFREK